eukprot:TRINITY_DN10343_c0_g1_i4.p2 TRINITY_DN10343_c0_g1~~TRINITY_DN10343_c0_g1_i4.p2  ORF type:complete len:207 (+),score=31.92 TRINITY_DN10343_c0_g1_i4:1199-1819(+)
MLLQFPKDPTRYAGMLGGDFLQPFLLTSRDGGHTFDLSTVYAQRPLVEQQKWNRGMTRPASHFLTEDGLHWLYMEHEITKGRTRPHEFHFSAPGSLYLRRWRQDRLLGVAPAHWKFWASLITRPLLVAGGATWLHINADTSQGCLGIAVLHDSNCTLESDVLQSRWARVCGSDSVDTKVVHIPATKKKLRLHFHLLRSYLFAFWFA